MKQSLLTLLVASVAVTAILARPISANAATVYVEYFNTIKAFASDGSATTFANTGLDAAQGLAFDTAGNLFAANYYDSNIVKFSSSGSYLGVFANTGLGSGSRGLAFDSAGNLYVANINQNKIMKFTTAAVGSVFASTGLSSPYGIAFDGAGNLFVADLGSNTIDKFTPDGVGSVFASTGLSDPYGLAFDSTGNLYASKSDNTIEKFTPGGVGSVFANTGLNDPYGLAFDSAGNLYVANNGSATIAKITPEGVNTVFASGLNGPQFVAVNPGTLPVPEPSSALLLLSGAFLCLGRRSLRKHEPSA